MRNSQSRSGYPRFGAADRNLTSELPPCIMQSSGVFQWIHHHARRSSGDLRTEDIPLAQGKEEDLFGGVPESPALHEEIRRHLRCGMGKPGPGRRVRLDAFFHLHLGPGQSHRCLLQQPGVDENRQTHTLDHPSARNPHHEGLASFGPGNSKVKPRCPGQRLSVESAPVWAQRWCGDSRAKNIM